MPKRFEIDGEKNRGDQEVTRGSRARVRVLNKFYLFLRSLLLLSACLALSSSCSLLKGSKNNQTEKSANPYLGVDFEDSQKLKLDADSLRMKSHANNGGTKKRTPVISYHFNAGEQDIFALVGVLKVLEREGVKPRLLSGNGWGFIFACLVAKFEKINSLEWAILKLSYKLKKKSIKLNSSKGLNELQKFAFDLFGDTKIEHLPLTVMMPVWNESTRNFKLIKRGKVTELFQIALREDFKDIFQMKASIYPDKKLMSAGSDIPLSFNVANSKTKYYKENQLKWNRLIRLQGEKFESTQRVFDVYQGLDTRINTLSDYIKRGENYGRIIQSRIRELLEMWNK